MKTNRYSAIVVTMAIAFTDVSAGHALAWQGPTSAGVNSLEASNSDQALELIIATAKSVKEQPGYDQKSLAEKSEIMSAAIVKALSGKPLTDDSIRIALSRALDTDSSVGAAEIYQAALQLAPSLASEIANQPAVYQQMQLIAFDVASSAANAAKSEPGFSGKSPTEQSNAITAAIANALAVKSFTPAVAVAAWGRAVNANLVSSEAALGATGVNFSVPGSPTTDIQTAANTSSGAPNVLVGLQGAASTSGSDGSTSGASSSNTSTPAPYDPCANVIAAYCGL